LLDITNDKARRVNAHLGIELRQNGTSNKPVQRQDAPILGYSSDGAAVFSTTVDNTTFSGDYNKGIQIAKHYGSINYYSQQGMYSMELPCPREVYV
jgi:hypothetical protein